MKISLFLTVATTDGTNFSTLTSQRLLKCQIDSYFNLKHNKVPNGSGYSRKNFTHIYQKKFILLLNS